MTKVNITRLSDGFIFECSGHAGYADKGADIVCAGISALCAALEARLSELASSGAVDIEYYHCADGEMVIEVGFRSDSVCRMMALGALETVTRGLERIEESYPDNLFME